MQEDEGEGYKIEIALDAMSGIYTFDGLVDMYGTYLNNVALIVFFCRTLIGVGLILNVVGLVSLVFGPGIVWVDRFQGPTFLQIIQIYPRLILAAGTVLVYLGFKISSSRAGTPFTLEAYVLENYCFAGPKDCDPAMGVLVEHLQAADFRVSRVGAGAGSEIR